MTQYFLYWNGNLQKVTTDKEEIRNFIKSDIWHNPKESKYTLKSNLEKDIDINKF